RALTILADTALPYEVLKRVMATCTDADYGRISLAVIQKEKPVAAGQLKPGQGSHDTRPLLPRIRSALVGRSGIEPALSQDPAGAAGHSGRAQHRLPAAAAAESRRGRGR